MALTTFDVPSGPVHARVGVDLDGLRLHDRVVVTPTVLQAGAVLVDLAGAHVWQGRVPTASALHAAAALAVDLLDGAPPSSIEPDLDDVDFGDLAAVAARLGGVGPGLTPAGDDCLAGILLIAGIGGGEAAEAELAAVAGGVETNDIAAAFLAWAARGQSIEPVHRFLLAVADGRPGDAAAALADIVGFGRSSGADLAMGLRLGLACLPSRVPAGPPGVSPG